MSLITKFRRPLPRGQAYRSRLARELTLIQKNGFESAFLQVREILDLVPEMRFITRGSAGCSLVAYLLGLHNMDPVLNKFALSRFMHESRPDLPDIDIDFAYNQRDKVMNLVMSKYSGRVGRISNHVMYRRRSALRQALREMGHSSFVSRHCDPTQLCQDIEKIEARVRDLEGTLKNRSLHCGGIVIFPEMVPEDIKLPGGKISLNKDEVEDRGLLKIDILCNRGLAQINDLSGKELESYPEYDSKTANIFLSGDTWGITFGESPAQRKLYKEIKPSKRADISFCLALIRPLPSADGRRRGIVNEFHHSGGHAGHIVYDDDGIYEIQRLLGCSESEAEVYRKYFSKGNERGIAEFLSRLSSHPEKTEVEKKLRHFALYSFCKAHAMSYGNLVWALAYEKARNPKKFWLSTLNHAQSMYKPWVHVQQSKAAGLKFGGFGRGPWRLEGDTLIPTFYDATGDGWSQYNRRGYWISQRFMPGMFCERDGSKVKFKGLIATTRTHTASGRCLTFITVGTATNHFLDIVIDGLHDLGKSDVVSGIGHIVDGSVQCHEFEFGQAINRPRQLELFQY